jgi:hypothetical protein
LAARRSHSLPGSIAQGIFRPAAPLAILAIATRLRQDTRDFLSGALNEARLKELLLRQGQLNAALDLDKSDAQAAEPVAEPDSAPAQQRSTTTRLDGDSPQAVGAVKVSQIKILRPKKMPCTL